MTSRQEKLNESTSITENEKSSHDFIWNQQSTSILVEDDKQIFLEQNQRITLTKVDLDNPYYQKLITSGYLQTIS
jgi:hypothetical protein